MILFLDYETTGVPQKHLPLSNRRQPRVCAAGAVLCQPDGPLVEEYSALVQPDGWEIPYSMTEVHGLTTGQCRMEGFPLATVMGTLSRLAAGATLIICFNDWFERTMTQIEMRRHKMANPFTAKFACAMKAASEVIAEPDWKGGHRFIDFEQCCQKILGRPPRLHHRALSDALDTRDLWFAIRNAQSA